MKGLVIAVLVVVTKYTAIQAVTENPLMAMVQQLAQTVDTLQAQVQALQNRLDEQTAGGGSQTPMSVAFLAQYSDDNHVGVASGPYVFDNAVMNKGNGYDPTTGIFTAPASGTYLIAVQLFTDGSQPEHPFADIKLNNQTLARMAFEADGEEDSDSTTITIHLNEGDRVWIQSDEGLSYHYWGEFHSFFTGTLIAADSAPGTMTPIP